MWYDEAQWSNATAIYFHSGPLSGSSFLVVLYTNIVLCSIGALIWFLFCRKLELYQPKYTQPGPSQACCTRMCRRMLSNEPFCDIASHYGLETSLYLLFQKHILLAAASVAVLTNAILLPVHLTGGEFASSVPRSALNATVVQYLEENWFHATQLSAVADDHNRLIAHVAVAYAVAVVIFYWAVRFISSSRAIDVRKPSACLEKFSIRLTNIPRWVTVHDIPDLTRSMKEQLGIVALTCHVAFDVSRRVKASLELRRADHHLKHMGRDEMKDKGLLHILKSCGCNPIEWVQHKYASLRQEATEVIKEWERQVEQDRTSLKCAEFAHLVFDIHTAAQATLQNRPAIEYAEMPLCILPATTPSDLNWANVGVPTEETFLRRGLVWILVVLWLIFFTTPLSVLTGLQNVLSKVPAVDSILHGPHPHGSYLAAFLYQYLPSLALLCIAKFVPVVVERMTQWERRASRRAHKKAVGERVFLYLLLASFVLPTLALSTAHRLIDAFTGDELAKYELQQSFIAGDGTVFINYVIMMMTFGIHGDLWRWYELTLYSIDSLLFTSEGDMGQERFELQQGFEFPGQSATTVIVFTVVLGYSYFIPWLSILGLIYFTFKHSIEWHHLQCRMFNNVDCLDQFGIIETVELWLCYVLTGLCLSQILLGLYFYFTALKLHSFLIFVLLVLTVAAGCALLWRNRAIPVQSVPWDREPTGLSVNLQHCDLGVLDVTGYCTPYLKDSCLDDP